MPRFSEKALEGRLEAISLFDVCQFLMLNRKTGTLTVRSGSRAAYLTFDQGQLLNAVDDSFREGESVVLQAVQWTQGEFVFDLGPVTGDRRIDASTENILLEAARQLDEMRAGESDEALSSIEENFRETQAKAKALSEAFRSAVSSQGERSLGAGWKETLVSALDSGQAHRVILGPHSSVRVSTLAGVKRVDPPASRDVDVWMDDLIPPPPGWSDRDGRAIVQAVPTREHGLLWVGRFSSSFGAWMAISKPRSNLPAWTDLGFTPDVHRRIEEVDKGALLLLYPSLEVGQTALAAWLVQRSAQRAEAGLVFESWPAFDWSRVPGKVISVRPEDVSSGLGLRGLVEAVYAGFVVLLSVRDPSILSEAISLSREGLRVLIGVAGETLEDGLAQLKSLGVSTASTADCLSGAWVVSQTSEGAPPSLSGTLLVPKQRERGAKAAA